MTLFCVCSRDAYIIRFITLSLPGGHVYFRKYETHSRRYFSFQPLILYVL